jgi:protein-tyrosine phosphatase
MSQEYEKLNRVPIHTNFKSAFLPENCSKNRYIDILPLEDTRVPLNRADYINANFVNLPNLNCICTQAPLNRTFKDFWTMVWQQNVGVVCALNRNIEKNVVKGESYWPKKKKKLLLGDLTLKLVDELCDKNLNITIRRIKIIYQKISREIYHLHYEGWPDFGVPESSLGIRELIRLSFFFQKIHPELSGPIIVHCSAGIGRSGSFIALASVMVDPNFKQLQKEYPSPTKEEKNSLLGRISQFKIDNLVLSLRNQRHPGMVQTAQQYKFIYMTLLDEIYNPTIVSETVSRVIQWQGTQKKNNRLRLSRSGPIRKTHDKKGDYDGFLVNHTSNDLCFLFKRIPKIIISSNPCALAVSDSLLYTEDRAFLCKSGPLVMVL